MDLQKTLNDWLKIQNKSFARKSFVDIDSDEITCDCSGFVNLLFKQFNLPLPYQINRPKAVHYFSVLQEIGSNKIDNIKEGHLLAWRKENLPKSGDTGHVLVTTGTPVRLNEITYRLSVIDSTKKQNGLSQREIELQTDKQGKILGVRWHLDESKIKRTAIYHQSLTESRYCFGCGLPNKVCGCGSIIANLDIPPIVILRHPNERKRTLSTVSLIKQRYPNVLVKEGEEFPPLRFTNPFLLFPNNETENLPQIFKTVPENQGQTTNNNNFNQLKQFILIDATWRKAKKIIHLNAWLRDLPKISVEPEKVSNYLIRKVSKTDELSSIEIFSIIMNDKKLNDMFIAFINKQIEIMGKSTYDKNYKNTINYSKQE